MDLVLIFRPVILTGNLSLEIRNAAVLASSRDSCKSGHTKYREMAFRLDRSIRHCSDNTITRKISSANYRIYRDSIAIVKTTIDSLS